jgi:hypothetical protein
VSKRASRHSVFGNIARYLTPAALDDGKYGGGDGSIREDRLGSQREREREVSGVMKHKYGNVGDLMTRGELGEGEGLGTMGINALGGVAVEGGDEEIAQSHISPYNDGGIKTQEDEGRHELHDTPMQASPDVFKGFTNHPGHGEYELGAMHMQSSPHIVENSSIRTNDRTEELLDAPMRASPYTLGGFTNQGDDSGDGLGLAHSYPAEHQEMYGRDSVDIRTAEASPTLFADSRYSRTHRVDKAENVRMQHSLNIPEADWTRKEASRDSRELRDTPISTSTPISLSTRLSRQDGRYGHETPSTQASLDAPTGFRTRIVREDEGGVPSGVKMSLRDLNDVDAREAVIAAENAAMMGSRTVQGKEKRRGGFFAQEDMLAVAAQMAGELKDDHKEKEHRRASSFGLDAIMGGKGKRRISLGIDSLFHGLSKSKAAPTSTTPTIPTISKTDARKGFSQEKEVMPSNEKEVVPHLAHTPMKLQKRTPAERTWKTKFQVQPYWSTFRVSPFLPE